MRTRLALFGLPLLLAAAGCVMPEQMAQYQKDVADIKASLDTVKASQTEIAARVTTIESKSSGDEAAKRSDVADLKAQQDTIVRQTMATNERIDQVSARVERLSQDVQVARDAARRNTAPLTALPPQAADTAAVVGALAGGAAGSAAAAPGTPPSAAPPPPAPTGNLAGSAPNPNALYTSAYADFSKGNYALAIQGFEEYAQRYPDTELADNALYWIGECQFSQGSYKAAVEAFDAMLEKYPKSDKAAAANLKKALAFVQLNQLGQGIEQLRYVTANYPGTDEARIASDRLQSLGKP